MISLFLSGSKISAIEEREVGVQKQCLRAATIFHTQAFDTLFNATRGAALIEDFTFHTNKNLDLKHHLDMVKIEVANQVLCHHGSYNRYRK